MNIPDLTTLANKSWQDLRNLTIAQVKYHSYYSLGFVLNDGQSNKGGLDNFTSSHTFDPTKNITRIECIIGWNEYLIYQINFYNN